VSRINIRRSTVLNQNVCARAAFTGLKPDFWKELSLGFGDYCKVYDGTDNTTKSRSIPCIALYPCCNTTGSWAFYSLLTKTRIRRMQWKKMVTSIEFIEKMNALNLTAETIDPVGNNLQLGSEDAQKGDGVVADNEIGLEQADVVGRSGDEPKKDPEANIENDDVPELVDQEDDDSDDEADDRSVEKEEDILSEQLDEKVDEEDQNNGGSMSGSSTLRRSNRIGG